MKLHPVNSETNGGIDVKNENNQIKIFKTIIETEAGKRKQGNKNMNSFKEFTQLYDKEYMTSKIIRTRQTGREQTRPDNKQTKTKKKNNQEHLEETENKEKEDKNRLKKNHRRGNKYKRRE